MRAGAQGLRDGKTGKAAPAEQQIAEALDKVARKMNGADAGGAKGGAQQLADQLDELRDARERLARLEKQIADAKQAAEGGQGRQPAARAGKAGQQPGRAGNDGPAGAGRARLARATGRAAATCRACSRNTTGSSSARASVMDRAQRGTPESGGRMATPEEHEWSRSAPGTEAFKQDYAAWQSLAATSPRRWSAPKDPWPAACRARSPRTGSAPAAASACPTPIKARVSKYFESIATKREDAARNDLRQSASAVGARRRALARRARRGLAGVPARADRRGRRRMLSALRFATLLWLVVCLMRPMVRATDVSPRAMPSSRSSSTARAAWAWPMPTARAASIARARSSSATCCRRSSPRFHTEVLRFGDRVTRGRRLESHRDGSAHRSRRRAPGRAGSLSRPRRRRHRPHDRRRRQRRRGRRGERRRRGAGLCDRHRPEVLAARSRSRRRDGGGVRAERRDGGRGGVGRGARLWRRADRAAAARERPARSICGASSRPSTARRSARPSTCRRTATCRRSTPSRFPRAADELVAENNARSALVPAAGPPAPRAARPGGAGLRAQLPSPRLGRGPRARSGFGRPEGARRLRRGNLLRAGGAVARERAPRRLPEHARGALRLRRRSSWPTSIRTC